MILYEDGCFRLDYDEKNAILYAPCPDIKSDELLYIHKVFSILMECLSQNDIKRLIVNSQRNVFEASVDEFLDVLYELTRDLTSTPVKKIARLASTDNVRETMIAELIRKMQDQLPFLLRSFNSYEAALEWLTEEKE